jgi:NTE family protein
MARTPTKSDVSSEECVTLVLQGGGALGAYQAGAYEGLAHQARHVSWVAGISIGSINAAIIAGNAPHQRVEKLREFWEQASSKSLPATLLDGIWARALLNQFSASATTLAGVPGFFDLRFPPAALMPEGATGASSFYDTAPLRATLERLVDFDRLNNGEVRLSIGAVNVETGNMTWFDTANQRIGAEHIMASGALPPGFPAVKIDGAYYWDGGLVSNTPLQYVMDDQKSQADLCVFQVDLFNARGSLPTSVWHSDVREKEIRFSSRTRFNTDMMRRLNDMGTAARRLYDKLPPEMKSDPDAQALVAGNSDPRITIAHLIYRPTKYEGGSKDYEFSRTSMLDHWQAGKADAEHTVNHPDWKNRHRATECVQVFDLSNR